MNDKSTSLHKLQNLDCVIERCHHVAVRCSNLGVRSHADQRCGAYTLVDPAEGLGILYIQYIVICMIYMHTLCGNNIDMMSSYELRFFASAVVAAIAS